MAGLANIFKGGSAQQPVQTQSYPQQPQAQDIQYTPSGVPIGSGVNTALFRQLQSQGFDYETAKNAAITGVDPRVKSVSSSPAVSQVRSTTQSVTPTTSTQSSNRTYSNEEVSNAINSLGTMFYGGSPLPQSGSAADIFALQDQMAKDRLNRTGLFALEKGIAYSPDQLSQIDNSAENLGRERLQALGQAYADSTKTGSSSTLSNQQLDNERALLSMYVSQPIVKDYNTVVSQKLSIDRILNSGVGGAQDLATVYSFMKALDPGSVVRESEYDAAAKSGNIFTGALARFNGLFNPSGGILSPQLKKEFQNIINARMLAQQEQYNNYRNQIRDIASRQGLNPDNTTIDFTGTLGGSGDIIRPEDVF